MRSKRAAAIAWGLWLAAAALTVAGVTFNPGTPGELQDVWSVANALLSISFALVFGLVGAVIVSRQPRNTIGWLMMVVALTLALQFALVGYQMAVGFDPGAPTLSNLLIAWYNAWAWWGLMGPLLLIAVLFPTGRPLTPRWRWVIGLLGAAFGLFMVIASFTQVITGVDDLAQLRNPLGFIPEDVANAFFVPWAALLLVNVAVCVSAIFVRYRRATLTERQQLKWLLYAFGFVLAAFALNSGTNAPLWAGVIFDLAIITVPIAIGVAILRYRLWDIDILIRRTLVYSMLTALLALAYFGSVLVLQSAFQVITGASGGALVTVLSTLFIAALFGPVRGRVQRVIDRRFFRRKYDAARTLAAFGTQARDQVGLEQLSGDLMRVVDETMQPASVSLWVRDQGHS
jgi:hypothetical protein